MVKSHVPLGILPAGTANVLAMELGIGGRMDRAARLISQSVPERISLGLLKNRMGSRYFVMMAGVGNRPVSPYTSSSGKFAYWVAGFSRAGRRLPQFNVTLHGRTHRSGFALASRVRNYGGDLEIASGASLLEDDFEVVLFEGRNSLRFAVYLVGALTKMLGRMRGVTVLRSRSVEFECASDSRIYVQIDGEVAGHLPATVEIVPSALTLLVPADFRERLGVKVTEALLPA